MRKNNTLILIALLGLLVVVHTEVGRILWPPKPKKKEAEKEPAASAKVDPQLWRKFGPLQIAASLEQSPGLSELASAARLVSSLAANEWAAGGLKTPRLVEAPRKPTKPPLKRTYVVLGDPKSYNLQVTVDSLGAGVTSVIANQFQEASPQGLPVWIDGKKAPLNLVPKSKNYERPSYVIHHYGPEPGALPGSHASDVLLDTLGKINWEQVEPKRLENQGGQVVNRAVFTTKVEDVRITKIYTLEPRAYHVGLEVKLELEAKPDAAPRLFHYQLMSAHGLPIEGEWYTSVFRNAFIGKVNAKNEPERILQDSRYISHRGGGDPVIKQNDASICYGGVGTQYFASVIAVDDQQKDKNFIAQATPILVTQAVKGRITSFKPEDSRFTLAGDDHAEYTFEMSPENLMRWHSMILPGSETVVVYEIVLDHTGAAHRMATDFRNAASTFPLFLDDIAVGMNTEPVKLKPGVPLVHKYVLYNGPVKVSQLHQLVLDHPTDDEPAGAPAVPPELVERYQDKLYLNTLTDFHSPGWAGEFASTIYWSNLLIKCTNVMHTVLGWLHAVIPNYGICIILLTVMVRGIMFPVSRKQTQNAMRMQQLAPELKKLQEKYKNDRQALGVAQMELYRKHQVNPVGSCWLIFLQMPVFLGLYYALQESIHFRLAPFLWIKNLAAPDMLLSWGSRIPWISRPEDYGGFLYLGPYFNLLPVIAVSLMIVQQKMMTPPAQDENQAAQQKMMKFMMMFIGLMFYKVAAGLCLYFIASSCWGFAERKMLPKRKPDTAPPAGPQRQGLLERLRARLLPSPTQQSGSSSGTTTFANAVSPSAGPSENLVGGPAGADSSGRRKNRNGRKPGRIAGRDVNSAKVVEQAQGPWSGVRKRMHAAWERVHDWWIEVLKQAEKR